jgi:AraC-like DNA-binding protein
VKEYIATHLADPISLPDLARAAGLTRMHFAAQFKAATGLRPREYVLRHRIAHAKTLLLESELKLVEIALASGFQTQAHFTTVFKKLTFSTPYEWRCRERDRQAGPRQVPIDGTSAFDRRQAKSRQLAMGTMESF